MMECTNEECGYNHQTPGSPEGWAKRSRIGSAHKTANQTWPIQQSDDGQKYNIPDWGSMSPQNYHDLFTHLDQKFNTGTDSPLHHDKRCPKCVPGRELRSTRTSSVTNKHGSLGQMLGAEIVSPFADYKCKGCGGYDGKSAFRDDLYCRKCMKAGRPDKDREAEQRAKRLREGSLSDLLGGRLPFS
jgi:hypothetical protein